jgi:uncharacterized protein
MIRVVLDTNVLVSGLIQPQGLPAHVLSLTIEGTAARLCVSGAVFAEYDEVIRRPRFKRTESEIANALRAIRETSIWVRISLKVQACADPDDDVFLECAQAARAHYLVTGNLRHFPSRWADTLVVSPHQFLDAIAEVQDEPDGR